MNPLEQAQKINVTTPIVFFTMLHDKTNMTRCEDKVDKEQAKERSQGGKIGWGTIKMKGAIVKKPDRNWQRKFADLAIHYKVPWKQSQEML